MSAFVRSSVVSPPLISLVSFLCLLILTVCLTTSLPADDSTPVEQSTAEQSTAETDQPLALEEALQQAATLDGKLGEIAAEERKIREAIHQIRRQVTDLQLKQNEVTRQLEQAESALKEAAPKTKEQQDLRAKAVQAQKTAEETLAAIAAAETAAKAETAAEPGAEPTAEPATEPVPKSAPESAEETKKKREAATKQKEDAQKQQAAADKAIQQIEQARAEAEKKLPGVQQEKAKIDQQVNQLLENIRQVEKDLQPLQQQRDQHLQQIESVLKQTGQWVSFSQQIAPVFHQRCVPCHNNRVAKGNYNMQTYFAVMSAGESGPAVTPGDEEFSLICLLVEDGSMPKEAAPLTSEQIEQLKTWVKLGARLDYGVDPQQPLIRIMPRIPQPLPPDSYPVPVPVTAVALQPEGTLLASSGYHEVLLWSVPEGQLLRRLQPVAERVYDLTFHPDGELLAVASGTPGQYGEVKIFHAATGELQADLLATEDTMFSVQFSPDGQFLAAAGADHSIRIFDLGNGQEIQHIEAHSDWVHSIAWSPDGKKLVSSSRDKTAKVFEAATGKVLLTFTRHNESVQQALFLKDGKQIASAGADRRLRVWNEADGKENRNIGGFSGQVARLVELPEQRLLSAHSDGKLLIHALADGKKLQEINSDKKLLHGLSVLSQADLFVAGNMSGQIYLNHFSKDEPHVWAARP